jgi:protein-S-isoprenylcysteine O-methyltransferase Ste14
VDIVKTAMEWLQLPHWLMIAGTLLVIAGLIGLVVSRRQQAKVQDDPATEQSPEPRLQLPPLPDLLDSRPRKSRR